MPPLVFSPDAAPTILLDRDGTLIEDRHYLSDPAGVTLLPGVGTGLQCLSRAGCRLFLISNQSGVGRGYFTEQDVQACQIRLDTLLADYAVHLTDAVWCPHAPEENCACRKPRPGLWERLSAKHHLRANRSIMIGDKQDDLFLADQAGLAVGILVLSGKGKRQAEEAGLPVPEQGCISVPGQTGRFVAADFQAAVHWILYQDTITA